MKKAFQALILGAAICFQFFTPAVAGVGSFLGSHFENSPVAHLAGPAIAHAQESAATSNCGVDDVTACIADFVAAIASLLGWIASIAGTMFDYFLWFTIDSATYSNKNQVIEEGWGVVRDIVNIFFVVGLLIAAVSLLFHIGETNGPKILVGIIVAALLVNFSLFFVRVIIDAGNITGLIFYNKIQAADSTEIENQGLKSISGTLVNIFNPQKIIATQTNSFGDISEKSMRFLIVYACFAVINFLMIVIFVSVSMFFLSRVIALWFSMIFAPFAIVSKAIPFLNNEKLKFLNFNSWFSNLMSNAFLVGVFMLLLYVTVKMSSVIGVVFTSPNSNSDNLVVQILNIFIPFILVAAFLWAAKMVAKALAGEFGEMTTIGVGWIAAGAVGAVAIGTQVVAPVAGLASRGLGRLAGNNVVGNTLTTFGKNANPFKWSKSTNPYFRGAGKALGGVGNATKWVAGKTLGINPKLLGGAAALGAVGGPSIGKTWSNIKKEAWEEEKKHEEEGLGLKKLDETIEVQKAQLEMQKKEYELQKAGKILVGQKAAEQDDKATDWKTKRDVDIKNAAKSGQVTNMKKYIEDYKAGRATVYDSTGATTGTTSTVEVKSSASINAKAMNDAADDLTYGTGYVQARDAAKAATPQGQVFDETTWRTQQQNAAQPQFTKTGDAKTIQVAQELRKKAKPEKAPPSEQETQLAYRQYQNAAYEQKKTNTILNELLGSINQQRQATNQPIIQETHEISTQDLKNQITALKQSLQNLTPAQQQTIGFPQNVNNYTYNQIDQEISQLENTARGGPLTGTDTLRLAELRKNKNDLDTYFKKIEDGPENLRKQESTQIKAEKIFTA